MIDPADLNDPAKAEAFLRDTIDDLTTEIDRLQDDAKAQIIAFRQRHADEPEAVEKFIQITNRRVQYRMEQMTAHREALVKVVARAKMYERLQATVTHQGHQQE